jgi:hypothetical protein
MANSRDLDARMSCTTGATQPACTSESSDESPEGPTTSGAE